MHQHYAVAVLTVALPLAGIHTSEALAGELVCDQTFEDIAFTRNVVVPPGAHCVLNEGTVDGNVAVAEGAVFEAAGVSITGNVVSSSAQGFAMRLVTTDGRIVGPCAVDGNVWITNTNGTLPGSGVGTTVVADIAGNLSIREIATPLFLAETTARNVELVDNTGTLLVGAFFVPDAQGAGPVQFLENHVNGNLTCAGNRVILFNAVLGGVILTGGNTITGNISGEQCAGFTDGPGAP